MFELNLPNVLTLLRILLVPVLVVALLNESANGDLLAAIVFALASATDAMDGYLARSRNAITTFGKLMDPIADKLLIIAALVALVSLHRLEPWVVMVIITREFAVTVTRMQATQQGVVIAANWWGKAKTIVQVAAIFCVIVAGHPTPGWASGLVYGAVAITIVSGVDYFFGLRRVLREADERREAQAKAQAVASSHSRIDV
jgi:CDP-diacylglycerol--glycerol-3-phosphate 3-phosphatidyltransferase